MCACGNNGCSGCGSFSVPEGPTGPQGPAGPAGTNGTNGTDGAPGPTWMSWSWSVGSDTPWAPAGGNAVYKNAAYVQYPGYNKVAVPGYVKVISRGIDASPDYDIRLYDVTNSKILAVITARTQTAVTTDALTISANDWPASDAILAVQVKDNNAVDNRVGLAAMTWHN